MDNMDRCSRTDCVTVTMISPMPAFVGTSIKPTRWYQHVRGCVCVCMCELPACGTGTVHSFLLDDGIFGLV